MLRRTKMIIAGYCVGGAVFATLAIGVILQVTNWHRHPEQFEDPHHHHEQREIKPPEAIPAGNYVLDGKTYVEAPFAKRDFDVTQRSIDLSEILFVGLDARSFPKLEEMKFVPAELVNLPVEEPVLAVSIGEEAKAYPIRMLNYHVVLNDVVAGWEVAVVWDPLTMTPKVFDRALERGEGSRQVLTFGNLGLIHKGAFLSYDEETSSIWWAPEGKSLAGSLTGTRLNERPFLLVSWGVWKERHPKTSILSLETSFERKYYSPNVYEDYFNMAKLPLPVEGWDGEKSPFKWSEAAIVIEAEGKAKAYPMSVLLPNKGTFEDTFAGKKIVIHEGRPPFPTDDKNQEIPYSFGAWFLWSIRYKDIEVYQESGEE
jgi:hypothetical protein